MIDPAGNKVQSTVFHKLYNTEAEISLSSPTINVGAFSMLDPTENPSLIDMKQAYGERCAVTWLLPHVAGLNASSSASNRMDIAAITLCCRDIILAFPWLTLAEFCVFCSRMRSLRYVRKRSDFVFGSDTIMQGLHEFAHDLHVEKQTFEREHHRQPTSSSTFMSHDDAVHTKEYQDALRREHELLQRRATKPQPGNITKEIISQSLTPHPPSV